MKIAEMKQILAKKFKDEGCCFIKQDIIIEKGNNKYYIKIKDFEHILFTMFFGEPDGYFDYVVQIINTFDDDYIYTESKNGYDIESALIELGYYIATRF